MVDWFNTGWDTEEAEKTNPYAGSGGGGGGGGPRRIWIPSEKSVRLLFVDDSPFSFWEHGVKVNDDWRNWFVCREKNKLDEVCVLCQRDRELKQKSQVNTYFIGFLTVIDLSAAR